MDGFGRRLITDERRVCFTDLSLGVFTSASAESGLRRTEEAADAAVVRKHMGPVFYIAFPPTVGS